jgi:hypothetical protein
VRRRGGPNKGLKRTRHGEREASPLTHVRPIERWVERMTAEVNRLEEQLRRALEGEA